MTIFLRVPVFAAATFRDKAEIYVEHLSFVFCWLSIRNVIAKKIIKKNLPMNVVSSIHDLHPKSTSSGTTSSYAHHPLTVANGLHFK